MNTLRKIAFIGSLLISMLTHAQQPPNSALKTVEDGVLLLLDTIQQSRTYLVTEPDRYFNQVETALVTIVDFEAVAKVVMSRYAVAATPAQMTKFGNILKNTLTRFYGAALASYTDGKLIFLPASNPPSDPRADTVVGMEIRGTNNNSFKLQYQMFLNQNDEWKLKNMSLGGINLGRQYNAQFTAAMAQYNNDIDQVLNNWK